MHTYVECSKEWTVVDFLGGGLASVCTLFPQLEKSQLSESLLPSVEANKDVCLSASVGTKVTLASPVVLGNQE